MKEHKLRFDKASLDENTKSVLLTMMEREADSLFRHYRRTGRVHVGYRDNLIVLAWLLVKEGHTGYVLDSKYSASSVSLRRPANGDITLTVHYVQEKVSFFGPNTVYKEETAKYIL